jgi:diguanylate cyclase (GGDEF)-like protein
MTFVVGTAAPRLVRAVFWVLIAGLAVHLGAGFAGHGADPLVELWLYNGLEVTATALVVYRVVRIPEQRVVWALFAGYLAMSTAGDLVWSALAVDGELAAGSPADVLYYLSYPLAYAGVVGLLRQRARWFTPAMWIDGLVGGLTLASLTAALVLGPVLTSSGDVSDFILNVGYAVGDLLLLCFVGLAAGLSGWRPGRCWSLIGLSLLATAIVDAVYSYQEATGSYGADSVLSTLWPAGTVAMAFASWQPRKRGASDHPGVAGAAMPAVFAAAALAVLGIDHWRSLTDAAVALALGAVLAVAARGVLTYRENVLLLRRTQREALTDALTGLGNRRQMMRDLATAMADAHNGQERTLMFFDLDGFKGYNDAFGHHAGDALLRRLGGALSESVRGVGSAYRLGGDEFCVLLEGPPAADGGARFANALSETGEGFEIGTSLGVVRLPHDTGDTATALQLADERMYSQKNSRRVSARRQARDLLLQILDERQPDLRTHTDHVADLAAATARELGLVGEPVDEVARAAEFHDIGKIAIPDSVLDKPGPLDDDEWELMRQHTVIGERILLAAPALRPVATLVRTSHERWDGTGYPDRLAGEAIPLGARIVSVCDAFDAMTSDRSYRRAMPADAAIAELRRHAGTQFDPRVVEAFIAALPARAHDHGRVAVATRATSSSSASSSS